MGDKRAGDVVLLHEGAQEGDNLVAALGVERGGGFVDLLMAQNADIPLRWWKRRSAS